MATVLLALAMAMLLVLLGGTVTAAPLAPGPLHPVVVHAGR
jgi:hypothetical protein